RSRTCWAAGPARHGPRLRLAGAGGAARPARRPRARPGEAMNRTENDLRAALAATERHTHEPGDLLDRVVAGARRRHRARLAGALVAGVLAVVLVAAGVPAALALLRPAPE